MGSLLLYIIAFLCSAVCAGFYQRKVYKNSNSFKEFLWAGIIMALPIVLACYRKGIGIDYDTYELLFNNFHNSTWSSFYYDNSSFEYLNKVLVDLGYFISGDVYGVFSVYAILSLMLFEAAIMHYADKISLPVSTLVFLLLLYPDTLNVIRQSLACAIVFYSIRYISSGDFKKYLICCLLATGIHTTAIITISFYLFGENVNSKILNCNILKIMLVLAPLLLAFNVGLFSSFTLFDRYFSNYDIESTDITISYVLKMPILLPFLFCLKRLKEDDKAKLLYYLFAMEMMLLFSSSMFKWGFRLSYYCFFGQIILVGYITNGSLIKAKISRLYFISWYLLCFYVLFYIWGRSGIFPYTHF